MTPRVDDVIGAVITAKMAILIFLSRNGTLTDAKRLKLFKPPIG